VVDVGVSIVERLEVDVAVGGRGEGGLDLVELLGGDPGVADERAVGGGPLQRGLGFLDGDGQVLFGAEEQVAVLVGELGELGLTLSQLVAQVFGLAAGALELFVGGALLGGDVHVAEALPHEHVAGAVGFVLVDEHGVELAAFEVIVAVELAGEASLELLGTAADEDLEGLVAVVVLERQRQVSKRAQALDAVFGLVELAFDLVAALLGLVDLALDRVELVVEALPDGVGRELARGFAVEIQRV